MQATFLVLEPIRYMDDNSDLDWYLIPIPIPYDTSGELSLHDEQMREEVTIQICLPSIQGMWKSNHEPRIALVDSSYYSGLI